MMPHAQQPSLWERVTRRKKAKAASPAPVTPVRDIPLTEKTLPADGVVRLVGGKKRYQIAGVMLCGSQCYVWLRQEGVTSGDMHYARVEALTLA